MWFGGKSERNYNNKGENKCKESVREDENREKVADHEMGIGLAADETNRFLLSSLLFLLFTSPYFSFFTLSTLQFHSWLNWFECNFVIVDKGRELIKFA